MSLLPKNSDQSSIVNGINKFPANFSEIWNKVSQETHQLLYTCPHTSSIHCDFVNNQLSVIIMLHEEAFPSFGLHNIRS